MQRYVNEYMLMRSRTCEMLILNTIKTLRE